jgi:MoaA/NifB/PqqE/SkfB family radical SAM enzyme
METEKCLFVLNQLSELKTELGTTVFPMFFDEPTLHPSFKQIMKHQLKKGLVFDQWWFSTNGYGLARMSDEDWKELAEAGFDYIRLTFHGVGGMHDELAGRKGAYEDLVETIRRAENTGSTGWRE